MFNLFMAELYKLKRSRMFWLFFVAALLPSLVNLVIVINEKRYDSTGEVLNMIKQNEMAMNLPVAQIVFAAFTAFLVTREYQERTVNSLFTYPFRRVQVYYAKLLVLLTLCVSFFLVAYVTVMINAAAIAPAEITLPLLAEHFKIYLAMSLMHFALVPVAYMVSLIGKTFFSSALIGVVVVILTGYVMPSDQAMMWFPWTAPLLLVVWMTGDMVNMGVDHPEFAIYSLITVFLVPFFFNMIYLARSDVHSGS